jgi:hypothetical protein
MTDAQVSAGTVSAPVAPGRLGSPLDAVAAFRYLEALGAWRDARKRELDQLDQTALDSPDPSALTGDIMLSMALWKAVSDRYELLRATWDSGRAGMADRERMSLLIWGRLDATLDPSLLARSQVASVSGAGLTVSLPEACRLSDALASQLHARLSLGGTALDVAERVRQLRATLERVRDQVDLEPAGAGQQAAAENQSRLARRLRDVADKAARGGDVGGLIVVLENEAATFERDLIVHAAQRRETAALADRARTLRRDLEARETTLRGLVDRCVAAVDPAPKYAVPDVDALGPVPDVAAGLQAYVRRLDQVSKAMSLAQSAYLQAISGREELSSRLEAYRAKAAATGVGEDPDLTRAYALAREALDRQPTRMVIAEQLVSLYQSYLRVVGPTGGSPAPRGEAR